MLPEGDIDDQWNCILGIATDNSTPRWTHMSSLAPLHLSQKGQEPKTDKRWCFHDPLMILSKKIKSAAVGMP
uniref:Uncharacterized protein n=1 Tax=Oryza rufipogon TaxID=4529 RepID=A0A679BDY7_ORYRU|nr:hypothetical protein [Oryza rufipogon]